ncbi:putative enzyme related to lactoylglutathione lyase [Chryseobacterium defluvii]|uniref:Putative enzyme related to lactoylglutathione lyase n=1 Tax=Chryseobacterium defluvii TaxID=160396 RepID=A0A840KJT2_9FLAO|nr:VOC family protein [Chryseobacterium defluvii]MBB4807132.1 putative enzyme related to lactoylglutathione lyase [Chryseobacterium defluvii]
MKTKLTHFAIHIDEIERAKSFYNEIFGWGFSSYGQSDFFQIKADNTEEGELIGAMQSRKYSSVHERVIGLECSFNVDDIDKTIEKIKISNGQILMPKTVIPYVGWIAKFLDTEGNLICIIQYDNSVR